MFERLKRLFERIFNKRDLRKECIDVYGEDFAEIYDNIQRGVPVGNMTETMMIIKMIDAVREGDPTRYIRK